MQTRSKQHVYCLRRVCAEKFSHCVLHYTISIIKLEEEEMEFLSIDFM